MEIIDYGVCRMSIVPVRREPADQSELVTQLLFGDDYEVINIAPDKKWLHIQIKFDQYQGWIDARQHHHITKEHAEYIGRADFKITTDLTASLLYNKIPLLILMGSIVPISGTELFRMEEQFAFNGESKTSGQRREFDFLKSILIKYLNAPYLWGGKTPFGIDCSGLTQMAFKIAGYRIPRDAWQQANSGKVINSLEEAAAGDLAFFRNEEGRIVHTGIIMEKGRIIHASGRVRMDELDEKGIIDTDRKIYSHQLSHIRRILA